MWKITSFDDALEEGRATNINASLGNLRRYAKTAAATDNPAINPAISRVEAMDALGKLASLLTDVRLYPIGDYIMETLQTMVGCVAGNAASPSGKVWDRLRTNLARVAQREGIGSGSTIVSNETVATARAMLRTIAVERHDAPRLSPGSLKDILAVR